MALDGKPLLTIAATFTAEPIEDTIAFWLRKFSLPFDIKFAAYSQVFQELIGESSLLASNQDGVNLLLVRLEDWQGGGHGAGPLPSQVEQSSAEFIGALRAAADRSAVPFVVCLCPPSPAVAADAARALELSKAEETILAELKNAPTIHVVTAADVAEIYRVKEYYSAHTDQIGHVPYTADYFTALGTMMSRRIWALRSRPHKVIVLDCDGTLWRGTVGEDGADGIVFGPPWKALQEFMVRQHDAGMLLCICSKNSEEDVFAAFDRRRDEMPLRREHIVSWRVNWTAKSENIRSLAKELELGLDSFIMVDDNPIECAEIGANCPEVLTLQLPPDEERSRPSPARVGLRSPEGDERRQEQDGVLPGQRSARDGADRRADDGRLPARSPAARSRSRPPRAASSNALPSSRSGPTSSTCPASGAPSPRCNVSAIEQTPGVRSWSFGIASETTASWGSSSTRWLPTSWSSTRSCSAVARWAGRSSTGCWPRPGRSRRRLHIGHVNIPFTPSPKNKPARDFLESFGNQFENASEGGVLFRFPSEFAASVGGAATEKRSAVELTDGAQQGG